jgi:hypothetical protein
MYTQDSNKRQIAQYYADLNFRLFPCHTLQDGACSCDDSNCKNIAKHPLTAHGCKAATNDPATLDRYFGGSYEIANVAVATGEPSGASVLDVDDSNALAKLIAQHGPFPQTWLAQTGSGGYHYFFRHDERWANVKNSVKFAGSLDVRTTGGYVLLPPSLHKTGNEYRWIVAPDACELATAPDWLMALLPRHESGDSIGSSAACPRQGDLQAVESVSQAKPTPTTGTDTFTLQRASSLLERAVLYLEKTPPAIAFQGGHNHTYNVACLLCELFGALTDDDLLSALESWNSRCSPPWTEKELRHKLASARSKVVTQETPTPHAETENAVDWPVLEDAAYHGIVGEIVRAIEPHTEADSAGVLLTLLACAGNAIGNGPHVSVGAGTHCGNLFAALVGDTASGKGQAWDIASRLIRDADPTWARECIAHGMSSGEGLVERVADPLDGDALTIPPMKRLLCLETEFARPITAMRREGNTLSPLLRSAWDRQTLEIMTRGKSKLRASNAFVSVVAHITGDELRKMLTGSIESVNGFANRFLWCVVRSSKSLPHGGDTSVIAPFIPRLREILERAKSLGGVTRSAEANRLWETVYEELKQSKAGSYGKAVERGRPQVVRLALLYAVLDCSPMIERRHLEAALAVWRYCDDSARIIFGGVADDASVSKLERRLRDLVFTQPGIMRSELRHAISHKTTTDVFDGALSRLIARREIVCVPVFEERQAERYYPAVVKGERGDEGDIAPSLPVPLSTPAPVYPTSPFPPPANVPAATLAELLEWRNLNSASFVRQSDGVVWVTLANGSAIPPAIEAALLANQETLAAFVPAPVAAHAHVIVATQDDDITLSPDDQAFYDELLMPKDGAPAIVDDHGAAFVAELEAMKA